MEMYLALESDFYLWHFSTPSGIALTKANGNCHLNDFN